MAEITLVNEFHGTRYTLQIKEGKKELSKRKVKEITRELCGMQDCQCSESPLGTRGRQAKGLDVLDYGDGTVILLLEE